MKKESADIWWIDDDHAREKSDRARLLKLLNQQKGLDVKALHPLQLYAAIDEGPAPDLFLVDFRLNKEPIASSQGPQTYPFTGTSLAGVLRSRFPDIPIYVISAYFEPGHLKEDSELFDRLLLQTQITTKEGMTLLFSDATDYRKLRLRRTRSSQTAIQRLLRVPKSSIVEIHNVLPEQLRLGLGLPRIAVGGQIELTHALSGPIRFARWTIRTLLRYPGILYDDLFAATYLGASEKYFSASIAPKLKKRKDLLASYKGIFCQSIDGRWWKSELAEFVFADRAAKKMTFTRLWEMGPEVLEIPKKDRAHCKVCGEPYPETVGYDEDDQDRRGPVHWRCSEPDSSRQPIPGFEPLRIFKDSN